MPAEQTAIARKMLDFINAWPNKPAAFSLESIGKAAPAAMLLQLASSGRLRTYVNGSYIGVWGFAVYLRLNKADTSEKLDALDLYDDVLTYFEESELPVLEEGMTANKIELRTTPSLAALYDNGTEDYQATYQLIYTVKK
ncbi:MAG: hypothetical protein RSC06_00805 [Clostridia bacterium]